MSVILIIGQDKTAFSCVDVFARLKTYSANSANSAYFAPSPFAARRLTGILNHRQIVSVGDFHNSIQIGRPAANMDRHDGGRTIVSDKQFRFHVPARSIGYD